MQKSYLPSKEFIIRIAIIVSIIVIVFGISKIFQYFKNKPRNEATVKVLVKDVVGKDSNNNGIADWEEYLWGLNPEKNGPENKQFILAKKKTLLDNTGIDITNQSEITENEQFSREFLSIILSLEQAGGLDQETLNTINEIVGQKIEPEPIQDIYTQEMIIVKEDSLSSATNYQNSFKKLVEKYKNSNIGDELVFLSEGMKYEDMTAMSAVVSVAKSYQEFGSELIKIPVPSSIAQKHLSLANNYEKTGQSVLELSKALENQMATMKAILNYKKYSDALVSDIEYISDNL